MYGIDLTNLDRPQAPKKKTNVYKVQLKEAANSRFGAIADETASELPLNLALNDHGGGD